MNKWNESNNEWIVMFLCSPDREKTIDDLVPLYIITPTYPRPEQLAELTRLSQTLMVTRFCSYPCGFMQDFILSLFCFWQTHFVTVSTVQTIQATVRACFRFYLHVFMTNSCGDIVQMQTCEKVTFDYQETFQPDTK
jgi:hypothetical protein